MRTVFHSPAQRELRSSAAKCYDETAFESDTLFLALPLAFTVFAIVRYGDFDVFFGESIYPCYIVVGIQSESPTLRFPTVLSF